MVGVQALRNTLCFPSFAFFARFAPFAFVAALVVALCSPSVASANSPTLTIGFTPSAFSSNESPEEINSKVAEFAVLVQGKTGFKIAPYVASSSVDLVQKIKEKKVDFAFMSALNFVEAESKTKLKVLLKKVWDQGYYHSVLTVRNDSRLRKLIDLKGQRIAFVDSGSASGYLYPMSHLKEIGLDVPTAFKSVVYSGSHEKSVELLRSKAVDAIAVFSNDKAGRDSAWTSGKKPSKSGDREFRVLWASAAIPNDPFCVREDFYERHPKIAHELMFGLIEMNEDATLGPNLRKVLGVRGLMVATSQQYEPVRQILRNLPKAEIKP